MKDADRVVRLVARARTRLRWTALAEAVAGPGAGLLLAFAVFLAVHRWTGVEPPRRLLALAALFAAVVAAARWFAFRPRAATPARHLDRELGTRERFATVLETRATDPALAAWAARGALAAAGGDAVTRALAFRVPAATAPFALAALLFAGLLLLPTTGPAAAGGTLAVAPAATGAAGGAAARGGAAGGPAAATGAATPTVAPAAPADRAAELAALEAAAREAGDDEAGRRLAEARAALERGDDAAFAAAMGAAAERLGGAGAASGPGAPGATGGGEAAAAGGTGHTREDFRRLPVPPRAREAVRRYFASGPLSSSEGD